ncbi:hypothetical protein P8A18_18905 [Streptomyces castrisilvae]|uniref:Transposase n=1 Tax=Streptomyces castrisilvae TaxID=3033811 RepID=A0ABY9HLQ9_9ACTN|nr:hypothetical protein [Streptomyces sp. Mut1]WLQ35364.1 hypothetical protein P8A18_18905 [Streptomyces sp. Mut1]
MIATLVLAQGAAEGYANWVFLQADVTPSGTWIDRWCGLRNAASSLDRDDKSGLPKEHRTFFEELGAWRNYLLHSDAKSRNSLRRAEASFRGAGPLSSASHDRVSGAPATARASRPRAGAWLIRRSVPAP